MKRRADGPGAPGVAGWAVDHVWRAALAAAAVAGALAAALTL